MEGVEGISFLLNISKPILGRWIQEGASC